MIGIIDYGAGNIGSVVKAFQYLSVPHALVSSPAAFETCKGIVLPGVGAFGPAMDKLRRQGFVTIIRDYIKADRPFIGICLGMQLLFEGSEESPGIPGIEAVKGTCVRFAQGKVPQINWNQVRIRKQVPLFDGIDDMSFFYFVHSYCVSETEPRWAAGITEYHIPFTSVLQFGNVCGVQFHPEKSGETGLQLLSNWVRLCGFKEKGAPFEKTAPYPPAKAFVNGEV